MYYNILRNTFAALLGGFVLSVLFGFFYRLPVPFAGIIGPYGEVSSSGFIATISAVVGAWWFYGFLFGGIILYFLIGSLLCITTRKRSCNEGYMRKAMVISAALGLIPVIVVSHLDKIIGPW